MKTKTLNFWFTRLLFLVLVCTVVGCSLLNKVAKSVSAIEEAQVVDKYEPSEQYYLGRGVSAVILDRYPPVKIDNAKTERQITYLNDMAGYIEKASQDVTRSAIRLGDHTERSYNQQQQVYELALYKGIQVGILETDEVAAHATPGGFLWLSYGAIQMCQTEDELAAVVAHEMSHIILDHGMANYREAHKSQVTTSTLSDTWFSGGGAVSNFGRLCVTYAEDAFNGYNPEQEFESDNWGTRALVASGYDPNAMVAVLKRVAEYEKAHDIDPEEYLAHHPPIEDRIKTVQELIKSEGFKVSPASQKPEAVKARDDRFRAAFK